MMRVIVLLIIVAFSAGIPWNARGFAETAVQNSNEQDDTSGVNHSALERRKDARKRLRQAVKDYNPHVPKDKVWPPLDKSEKKPGASADADQRLAAFQAGFNPAVNYNLPNFANSPNIRKFVDSLPGLGAPGCTVSVPAGTGTCNENNLGQYIPVANPDTATYPGSDYYEIGLQQYQKRMHSDLPAAGTKLRGYFQINSGTVGATDHSNNYLGPLLIANRDRAVRIKFVNLLGIGASGDLPLPVDTMIMGAGMGSLTDAGAPCDPYAPGAMCAMYTQNRSDIHLHGGLTPWISDGTPHQWITPAGDPTPYKKGASFQNVPDMIGPGKSVPAPADNDGIGTYYYPNQQSARLMFYHDHAYGITRLNVYAGVAAGYLLTDQVEEDLISGTNVSGVFGTGPAKSVLPDLGGVYHYGIPLIIQDKTFVNDATTPPGQGFPTPAYTPTSATSAVDPLWYTYVSGTAGGDLWLPHEYMPNEDITNPLGYNPMGRWDYGPWMVPPMLALNNTLPSPTLIPEAFGDTAMVNGTAFPYVTLPPAPLRFRILNACNDRMLNLQIYYAATPAGVICKGPNAPAQNLCTEVSMVPASPNKAYPTWPKDGREGGVPDPTTVGPDIIQIGNEGGFLAKQAVLKQQPVDFDYNRRSVTFGGVTSKTLLMPPAVRADVIVDFSSVPPGSTLMLYNDGPAPMPLYDDRNDYFTDDPDHTAEGGAPPTPAGFGPNTRTVMQIRIDPAGVPSAAYDLAGLQTVLPKAFALAQDRPLVPETAYNPAFPGFAASDIYVRSVDESLNVSGTTQSIAKVVLEVPGQGYTTAPTVVFSGGGCDYTAAFAPAATASLNGVTGITLVTAGTGYTTPPTVAITGGGGTGATAQAIISGGVVTTIVVTNPGSNYTAVPNVAITGGGGTGATATATITLGSVGAITVTNASRNCTAAPQVYLEGGGGSGAMAASMLNNSLVLNGKNIVEGFDMEYGRMNAVLGSTPNLLAPAVGAGPVIGAAFYVDPPTEILRAGEAVLWRISPLGVDSHAVHFHLFNVQVVNRVDWTNTIKPPYEDELGWKETIRTNPFEDVIVALRPASFTLPFSIPDSNRLLDPTSPLNSTGSFQPVAPPPGLPAVAQITNVPTNFGGEYVWHCHLLGHEENDMMRPMVLLSPPNAPTNATAVGGNAQATVSFTAPVGTGGSPVASYLVTSIPGGITATGTASPITVTGLTNGTAYTFTVAAVNAIGTGPASLPSNSVTPATVPGAPTIGTATAGDALATVSFTPPASNGGSPITLYTARSNPGGITATGTASPITVMGLTNGTAYTFTVTATNAVGTGPASAASNSVTPVGPATVPGAPTIGIATPGNAQASVSFTPPASNGGSPITSYRVTSNPGGITATGTASPITVAGLTNGTSYTFTVAATNAVGTGPASGPSNSVVPNTVAAIIVDNGAAGTSSTAGTCGWSVSGAAGFYGANSIYGCGGGSYTWHANLPQNGNYQVYVWWTNFSNRSTSAPYTITYNGGSQTVNFNQQTGGGQWVYAGTYNFTTAAGGTVRLSAPNAYPVTYSADAVKFVYAPGIPDVVVDNGGAGTSSTAGVCGWSVSSAAGFYGANSIYGCGGGTYTWHANLPQTGNYDVYAWWTIFSNRTTSAPYTITYTGGATQTVNVNQQINGGQWNLLGTFAFDAATGGTVRLNATSPYPVTYSADAVKFVAR